jgi:ADP-ribosyl-[dinitrogen reductase] hydrolase
MLRLDAPLSIPDRYAGCLLGLACGDAVGTTVEFMPRGSFPPVTDMIGGGPFGIAAGQWTDDTSMALCLAESLIDCNGFDANDQMRRYVDWWRHGYMSSTGRCFDIGGTVQSALARFEATGDPNAGSSDPDTAGNGSLMRLAPVALFYFPDLGRVRQFSADSSRTTHAAPEAVECCEMLAAMMSLALAGESKEDVLTASHLVFKEEKVARLAAGDYMRKSVGEIAGIGYCVPSLEAALWCFHRSGSFEDAVLRAANLGDDADTTAAIVGQLAGAFYGKSGIPQQWLERLYMRQEIDVMAARLYESAGRRGPSRVRDGWAQSGAVR